MAVGDPQHHKEVAVAMLPAKERPERAESHA